MPDLTQYIPHGLVAALGTVVAWIGRDHMKRDDDRFNKVAEALQSLDGKLTTALTRQADNHAEVLRLMIQAGKGDE